MIKMLKFLCVKLPLAILYGIGVLLMLVACIPCIIVGFFLGFVRWAGDLGDRLADKAITRVFYNNY